MRNERRALALGAALVLAGCVLNEWLLVRLFSPDGVVMPVKLYLIRAVDVGLILLGACLVIVRPRVRLSPRILLLGGCSLLLSLLLLEGGLRLYYALQRRLLRQQRQLTEAIGWKTNPNYRSERVIPGYGLVRYSTTNDGFRVFGEVNTDRTRILVLGDSSTEAVQVSDGETYYDYLRLHHPGLEVFAYGSGGYGSLQEYMVLDAFFDRIRPDIIVWQFDGNDLADNCYPLDCVSPVRVQMMRPYLVDGEIKLLFAAPAQNRLLGMMRRSYLARLLSVVPKAMVEGQDSRLRAVEGAGSEALRAEAAAVTREIMQKVKERASGRPVVAFCIYEGLDGVYESICRDLGFHYMDGLDEALRSAQAAGEILTGMVDGRQTDSHLNAKGHAIVGRRLLDFMVARGLIP